MRLSEEQLSEMIALAKKAQANAYCPHSKHPVGSSIMAEGGSIYAGCNVETANYKGICAEGSAISAMIYNGDTVINTVVVIGPTEHLCTPCGDCRQRIREFATAKTEVIVVDCNGENKKEYLLDELLPDSFGPENLNL